MAITTFYNIVRRKNFPYLIVLIIFGIVNLFYSSCNEKTDEIVMELPEIIPEIRLLNSDFSMIMGDSTQLQYAIIPDTIVIPDIVWSSENETIATIDQTGLLVALYPGATNIAASSATYGIKSEIEVDVLPITLSQVSFDEEVVVGITGGQLNLELNYFPENAFDKTVSWRAVPADILQVIEPGKIADSQHFGYSYVEVYKENTAIYDAITIIPANDNQLVACIYSKGFDHENQHFVDVYLGSMGSAISVSQVRLYRTLGFTFNTDEMLASKSITASIPAHKASKLIRIEISEAQSQELDSGSLVALNAEVGGVSYLIEIIMQYIPNQYEMRLTIR